MSLLSYIPLLLLVALALELLKRKACAIFPWFFTYIIFAVVAGVLRFLVRNHSDLYFDIYWASEAGYILLSVGVLYEVFRAVFRNLAGSWWFPLIFPSLIFISVVLVVIHTWKFPPQLSDRLSAWIITSELGVRLLQGLLFVVLVICVAVFGLRWRQYAFGISAGFGLYATVVLIATSKISDFGTRFAVIWGWVEVAAYSVTVVIWLWYFRKPQKPDQPNVDDFFLRAKDLERYRRVIRRIRAR